MKIAKLVKVSLVTRVVVDLNATEDDIMEVAAPKLSESLMDSPLSHLDSIEDDVKCPYVNFVYDGNGHDKELIDKFNEIAQGYRKEEMLHLILRYHCDNSDLADIADLLIERRG
jgi:hypothetical protein